LASGSVVERMTADWKEALAHFCHFVKGGRLFLSSPLIGDGDLSLRRWMPIPHRDFWAVQAVFEVDGMNSGRVWEEIILLITFRVRDLFFRRSFSVCVERRFQLVVKSEGDRGQAECTA
jgi:hypothetical protein